MKQPVSKSAGQPASAARAGRTRYYRDLHVWQKSMQLVLLVYRSSESFPKSEAFGLTAQMRRAAVSVPSNIAEGHGRLTDGNMRVFLAQARGSLYELETQVELASALEYLNASFTNEILESCAEVGKMLNGLLSVLDR